MADVAQLAGVSHQTVSRVLNDFPSIRPETRRRVLDAIQQLGYRRNTAARTLASRRSRTIGIVSADLVNFGPSSTMAAVEQAAREQGFNVSLTSVPWPTSGCLGSAFDLLAGQDVEAVVAIAWGDAVLDPALSARLGVPVVVVQGARRNAALTVAVDHAEGARLATRHLLDLGHDTVLHVAGPADWVESAERIDGWRSALREADRPVPRLCWRGDWSASSGYQIGLRIAKIDAARAIFVANDQMALGLLRALREAGRLVPGQVSVVGFDDVPESAYFAPPLTTVRQDFAALGRSAMELVWRAIDGEVAPTVALVPAQLIERGSTAQPQQSPLPNRDI